jgi:hypothetical protein
VGKEVKSEGSYAGEGSLIGGASGAVKPALYDWLTINNRGIYHIYHESSNYDVYYSTSDDRRKKKGGAYD